MKPGRELDALIAEKVMGWIPYEPERAFAYPGWHTPDGEFLNIARLPPYSTDITAAWEVVDKLKLAVVPIDETKWWAGKMGDHGHDEDPLTSDTWVEQAMRDGKHGRIADTAPHAICLAALKVMGAE